MPEGSSGLRPRTGPADKLLEGPRVGQRSLYQQQVLDEDTYTEALSSIITRDFFPNLPHIHATNAYLAALTNNDPELLSSSIRKLAQLAQAKEDAQLQTRSGQGSASDQEAMDARRREFENAGTPYITKPGGPSSRRLPQRTPVGARGWDTPDVRSGPQHGREGESGSGSEGLESEIGEITGPSQPKKRRRRCTPPVAPPRVRDDLSLDAFQRNYTSQDNASFVQIVDTENQRRAEERWGWAWEVEKRANIRRLEGEARRKAILDTAARGDWKVDANGRRLIGALSEGGKDQAEGEAWKREERLVTSGSGDSALASQRSVVTPTTGANGAVVVHAGLSNAGVVVTQKDGAASQSSAIAERYTEEAISSDHPLGRALAEAGLPSTALISKEDGALVPVREATSGMGDGRGRGQADKADRDLAERIAMSDERHEHLGYAGSGADQWGYKARNNFYFPADANASPYPAAHTTVSTKNAAAREAPPSISHSNTRLPDEDEVGPASNTRSSSRRGSSPARSWVEAAVKGTPYHPRGARGAGAEQDLPSVNNYPLLPHNPSPSPEALPSLLTWGTLMATPRALDGSDDPLDTSKPSFKLPETRRRDVIGRKLGDKASRSMNERAKGFTPRPSGSSLSSSLRAAAERASRGSQRFAATPGQMAPPSSTPRRSDNLTPAGKRLLERSLGRSPVTASGRTGVIGASSKNRGAAMEIGSSWSNLGVKGRKLGEMSWTPSPAHRK